MPSSSQESLSTSCSCFTSYFLHIPPPFLLQKSFLTIVCRPHSDCGLANRNVCTSGHSSLQYSLELQEHVKCIYLCTCIHAGDRCLPFGQPTIATQTINLGYRKVQLKSPANLIQVLLQDMYFFLRAQSTPAKMQCSISLLR